MLEERARELGSLAAGPVGTLARALEATGRASEAVEVVRDALRRRSGDGELPLARGRDPRRDRETSRTPARSSPARRGSRRGRRGCGAPRGWRCAAGAFTERKTLLEALLEREPLDAEVHASYASALAAGEGAVAARAFLERAWRRMPHRRPLAHVFLEWTRGAGARALEAAAREVLQVDPSDAWTHRELAVALVDQGRMEEAREALVIAAAVAPAEAALERARARLLLREGREAEARAALLAALELEPDHAGAIGELFAVARSAEARTQALAAVERIVQARSVTGAGLQAWFMAARATQGPAAVGATLDRLRASRPDLAPTWTTSIEHRSSLLVRSTREALAYAADASARFPLTCAVWIARSDALLAARGGAPTRSRRSRWPSGRLPLRPGRLTSRERPCSRWRRGARSRCPRARHRASPRERGVAPSARGAGVGRG